MIPELSFLSLLHLTFVVAPLPSSPVSLSLNPSSFILFFDGASKVNPSASGGGGIIISPFNRSNLCFRIGLATGMNNVVEFNALIQGLHVANVLDIESLLVYGDSIMVISAMNSSTLVKNVSLSPLLKEALHLTPLFSLID
eukprot:Gb_12899 [translate_table: standard]